MGMEWEGYRLLAGFQYSDIFVRNDNDKSN